MSSRARGRLPTGTHYSQGGDSNACKAAPDLSPARPTSSLSGSDCRSGVSWQTDLRGWASSSKTPRTPPRSPGRYAPSGRRAMVGKDITIGQYLARETALHRLDPRLKVIAVIAGAVVIFLYGSGWGLLAFAGMLMVVLILARMPLWPLLKSLRTVWVIILITALLQFFLTPGKVVFSRGFLTVTDTGLYNGLIFSSRVVILVLLLAALVMTTPPLALADALSSLFSPLRRLKIPVGHVTNVMSITLMFIPNILEVGRKVMRAQMARGADFESWNVFRRVRDIVPVLVPLFVKVFHDAEELALAMDARAYPESGVRTRLHPLRIGALETVLTLAFVGLAIGLTFCLLYTSDAADDLLCVD